MILEIPDQVFEAQTVQPQTIRLEIAVLLYAKELLTLEQASKLALLDQHQFQSALADREVPLHYGVDDLQEDVETLQRLGRL